MTTVIFEKKQFGKYEAELKEGDLLKDEKVVIYITKVHKKGQIFSYDAGTTLGVPSELVKIVEKKSVSSKIKKEKKPVEEPVEEPIKEIKEEEEPVADEE